MVNGTGDSKGRRYQTLMIYNGRRWYQVARSQLGGDGHVHHKDDRSSRLESKFPVVTTPFCN
jgi:hypothetical protein